MKSKLKSNKKQTINRLAKILGCSRQVIASQIKRGGAPALDDVPGWTAHLAAFGRIGSQAGDLRKQIAVERLAILKETRAKLERDNAQQRGELISFSEARRQAEIAACEYFNRLDLLANECPAVLVGLSAVDIHVKLCERREQIRDELNAFFEAVANAEQKQ